MITHCSSIPKIHTPRVAEHASPMAFAQGQWVGFEDGFRQEKAITIKEDGSLVSKNKVYGKDGKLAQEGSVVIELRSQTTGYLTFFDKGGSKIGVEGPCKISRDRIECRGNDFKLNVYLEDDGKKLVFAKASRRLYGDDKFHYLKMVRA